MRKILAVGIILLFIGGSVVSGFQIHTSHQSLNRGWLYVGGDGPGNYTSIQSAINDANPGDTIFVYDDSSPYYEGITVNKALNLIGENKNTTVIDAGGNGDVIKISADGVCVEGFTLQNSGEFWQMAGVDIVANCSLITNNNIKDCCDGINIYKNRFNNILSENSISSTQLNGIGLWYSSNNNSILNNTIHSNKGDGIQLFCCQENKIIGNTLSSNNQGIYLSRSNTTFISDNLLDSNVNNGILVSGTLNIVCNNTFFNDGIFVSVSITETNDIVNNTVNNKSLVYLDHVSDKVISIQAGQIILVYCENITIQNQELTHTSIGIQLEGSDNCVIVDNCLADNRYGIHLHGYDHHIMSNTILNNSNGLYCITQRTNIEGNLIANNEYGIDLIGWNNTIKNNIISENKYGLHVEFGSNNNIMFNNFLNNSRNAGFSVFSGDRINNWTDNYWERPRIFPKLILGKMRLGNSRVNIPWINFDWHPLQEPYDIP
ncbi:hypothetical protein AYK25_02485 [Thermoplasmatales archaeon SM1-50]|nr:MAG: hypothetical protein AYK25_02485 [Thermoplasmatales archaeon SM1-50]